MIPFYNSRKQHSAPSVSFETLGCKLNQYETDSIATALMKRGFRIVPFGKTADACVINTCTVTNKADRKSRNALNKAVRTGGAVVLTGCFVDSHWDSLQDSTATYVVDNKRKSHIPDILSAHFCGEILDIAQLEPQVFSYTTPEQIFRTRTNIKIQDGCDNFCTFCIIPFVRGRAVSRNADSVLQEAKEAIAAGSKELILTGVNMSRYNDSEIRLAALMERILELDGDFRVRLSSIEPDNLSAAFLDLMSHPKFCPHLHLCLQSGSDRILLKMRRMYSLSQYQEIVHCLRKQHEHFNITTDIIVGFPKEEQEDFLQSVEAVSTFGISHVHIFPFSVRSGTRAERMTGTIPAEEQKTPLCYPQRACSHRENTVSKTLNWYY